MFSIVCYVTGQQGHADSDTYHYRLIEQLIYNSIFNSLIVDGNILIYHQCNLMRPIFYMALLDHVLDKIDQCQKLNEIVKFVGDIFSLKEDKSWIFLSHAPR